MPVTLNPPPFPTPDNTSAVAADKAADGHAAPRDAFAALLLAVGDPAADPGKEVAGPSLPADANDASAADQLRALRAVLNGGQDKLPVISLPVLGRDPAIVGLAIKPDAGVDTAAPGKADDDKPGTDLLAASDLAGMTAALNAMLASATTSTPAATQAAASDSKVQADSHAKSIATSTDAALARRDILQADVHGDAAAQNAAAPSAATSSALAAAMTTASAQEPANTVKSAPASAGGVDATSTQSQLAALQHNFAAIPTPQIVIATPVTSPAWQHEFADRLGQVVMTGSDRAEFRVHPAEMGPVNVSINMTGDQASVTITAAHGATRDALEQALPQLRELLANQGITLGQASVQSENRPQDQPAQTRDFASSVDKGAAVDAPVRMVRRIGLVDVFA